MPKALVLGVNGQDGSYVAEALLKRGYVVAGVGRQERSRYVGPSPSFSYCALDIEDNAALIELLRREDPDFVFHAAAVHGSAGFTYEPVFASMLAVNVQSLQALLEHARLRKPTMRIVYANSAKVFPAPLRGRIDEDTPMRPTCLYSIGKLAAMETIRHYRRHHGVAATNLILFNHESPRRGADYFLPTIARGLRRALTDRTHRFEVKTLDFWMDWSSAEELMDIAVDIAERAPTEDFILASGVTTHARRLVQDWFARNGLDYGEHVAELLPTQASEPGFQVVLDRLEARIGRKPVRGASSIVDELADPAHR